MFTNTEKIKIIYEDDYVLVISKPSGLVVHSDGRTEEETLVDWLEKKYPTLKTVGKPHTLDSERYTDRWGMLNRLDRDTSGLVLIAKDEETFKYLEKQYLNHSIKKEYLAKVHGEVDVAKLFSEGKIKRNDDGSFKITEPLSRHKKDPRVWVLGSDENARQTQRDAETDFIVDEKNKSIIHFFPKTGRTHQLRLHAKYLGHPIEGDKKYSFGGIDNISEEDRNSRLMLHAQKIEFIHPKTNKKIVVEDL